MAGFSFANAAISARSRSYARRLSISRGSCGGADSSVRDRKTEVVLDGLGKRTRREAQSAQDEGCQRSGRVVREKKTHVYELDGGVGELVRDDIEEGLGTECLRVGSCLATLGLEREES
jgi:hypothetical protein